MASTIRLHFNTNKSRAKARWLILTADSRRFSRTVGNRPPRDLIVDADAVPFLRSKGVMPSD